MSAAMFSARERQIMTVIANRVAGFHPGQREMWSNYMNQRKVILFAGRGWGKSYFLTTAAAYTAMKDPYRNILMTGTQLTDAWNILAMDRDLGIIPMFEEARILKDVNKSERTIKLLNGTRIWVRGAEQRAQTGGRGARYDHWYGDEVGVYPNDDLIQNICLSERQPPAGRPEGMTGLITTTTFITNCTIYLKEHMTDDWHEYTRSGREAEAYVHRDQVKVWDVMEATDYPRYRREVLCDIEMSSETAIMTREQIDKAKRVEMRLPADNAQGWEMRRPTLADMERIHICSDHNVSTDETGSVGRSENGLLVMGSIREHSGNKNLSGLPFVWLLEDLSMDGPEWEIRAIEAYMRYGAERLTIETNQGGRYIKKSLLLAADKLKVSRESVNIQGLFSRQSKENRALPVTGWCQSGRIGFLCESKELERQLISFNPAQNANRKDKMKDDRADAFVFGVTSLSKQARDPFRGLGG